MLILGKAFFKVTGSANTNYFGKFLLGLTLREVTGGESRLFGVLAKVFVNVRYYVEETMKR